MKRKKLTAFPVEFLHFDTYIRTIRNSVGTMMFRNAYLLKKQRQKNAIVDATEDGNIACAFYLSSVLLLFGIIKEKHLTVKSTVADMEKSGWIKIKRPRVGSVIVWEPKLQTSGRVTRHIGFYIGKGTAISHRDDTRTPREHQWLYKDEGETRKVEAIYWHPYWDLCLGKM
ncbi:MAG: hypothetical protein V1867_01560 [Candidatus Falkowbacteria bacterium]